jgi:aspartate/glutamate racemase
MANQRILVIGGMGPQAGVRLVDMIMQKSIDEFGATKGEDFPEVVLCSLPVPDFIDSSRNQAKALQLISQRLWPLC